ncbi:hypothetical protein Q4610_17000 [Sphingobium sp. HBC34]|uniref:HTH DNA binding domain-containing protein n=1 Tax=Sphingobium cyanobacteriorum TaxID=3063954 RepID=A0ABT8ZQM4_9SPHN|nr:hypothetical protein [Sphingobium sp. HBC34]MDO7836748.1 hypothetical protein [Sphingobium sp. HBC34]
MAAFSYTADHALLLLGRLDGRLVSSPVADIWLARARLRGAARLATMAGVPVETRDLQDWISGRSLPPRHSEGLNDPLSVAALFHFALSAGEDGADPVARATLNIARQLLDDRAEAALWGQEDLVRFGPLWRQVRALLDAPYPLPSLPAVAQRLLEARYMLDTPQAEAPLLTTADGRQLRLTGVRQDKGWIIACHLPLALQRAGLTLRLLPLLTDLPRFLPDAPDDLVAALERGLIARSQEGLADLDRLETRMRRLPAMSGLTKRSRVPLLTRLELAYPGLSKVAIARLLGISHQGATKLVAQFKALMGMQGHG